MAKEFRTQSAVVWQRDILLPTATVREAIMTSAQLKLAQRMPASEKKRRVDDIIRELVREERERDGGEERGSPRARTRARAEREQALSCPPTRPPSPPSLSPPYRAWTIAPT